MNIRSIYKKHRQKKQLAQARVHVRIHPDAILGENFSLDLRSPKSGETYLEIGARSMVDSSFVFETETGHIRVGENVHIGGGTQLISKSGITIGNDVIIAWGCTIYDHNSHSVLWEERKNDVAREWENAVKDQPVLRDKDWSVVRSAPITIKDKAWIGFGVTVLKGVTIGEGAVIGAGSVVTADVPPYTLAAGNPARAVRTLEH